MLLELAITDLGVLEHASVTFGPGLTAVTGETGAGKTMIVGAIDLLVGGRAHPSMVRPGADEAVVEGRFLVNGEETVVRRVIPRDGRSRAYRNGRLATVGELAELGVGLVDLHGQHAHQSLLHQAAQRECLDRFGRIDLVPRERARAALAEVDADLAALGGDERARAREIDLLRFQVDELEAAGLTDAAEDDALDGEEERLAGAVAHQGAAAEAVELLGADGSVSDLLGQAQALLDGRGPFVEVVTRVRSLASELADLVREIRSIGESIEDDPERLASVRARRQLLFELRRKYGDTLSEVLAFHDEAAARLNELEQHDRRAAELDARRAEVLIELGVAEAALGAARMAAAPVLAAAVESHLVELAMPKARFALEVDGPGGDDVTMLLSANPGADLAPLARTASGGELARTMLAIRLVLTEAPPTLVFDEVDAGIGGQAAHAVGRSLARIAENHQVLVVTHLAQVAAFAHQHVAVAKSDDGSMTVTQVIDLTEPERVIELSRMLSGSPNSSAARGHAEELLAAARTPGATSAGQKRRSAGSVG